MYVSHLYTLTLHIFCSTFITIFQRLRIWSLGTFAPEFKSYQCQDYRPLGSNYFNYQEIKKKLTETGKLGRYYYKHKTKKKTTYFATKNLCHFYLFGYSYSDVEIAINTADFIRQ